MEILAYGVASYERPLLTRAFDGHHDLRCLDVNLDEDTAVLAQGHEIVSTDVNAKAGAEVLRRSRPAARGCSRSAPPASTTST